MSKQSEFKNDERQVFIIPPVIIKEIGGKKLSLLKAKGGDEYQLELGDDVVFKLQEWEYHVLNALFSFGGDKYETLLVNTNDRFGLNLKQHDIDVLLERIRQRKLFDKENAPKHPLTKPFYTGEAKTVNLIKASDVGNNKTTQEAANENKGLQGKFSSLVERVKADAKQVFKEQQNWSDIEKSEAEEGEVEIDPKAATIKALFNPTKFLGKHKNTILLGKYLLYPLPLVLMASLFILLQNPEMVSRDFVQVLHGFGIFTHLFFGLVTVSLVTTFATACVAHAYSSTVRAISVILFFGFIPRFTPIIEDTAKLNRKQKLWLHATPLIARLGVFCLGVIMWYNSRYLGNIISEFSALLALTSLVSFFVASCPFYKSNGYRFLVEFFNEPNLWGKSVTAFLNKVNKDVHTTSDRSILVAYAVICMFFTFGLAATVFIIAYHWFSIEIGQNALFIIAALVAGFMYRVGKEAREVNEEYHRNLNFVRWRDGAFPTKPEEAKKEVVKPNYKKRLLLASSLVFLILPYNYQPSGQVIMLPFTQQKISTDISGIVNEVYFEGGEFLQEGTVIAKLSTNDYQAELNILQAKLQEKAAQVDRLKSFPRPEDVSIAEEQLELAYVNVRFSGEECERQRPLHESGSISQSEMAKIEEACNYDQQQVLISEAQLDKVLSGASQEEIAVAELSLLPLEAEIKMYQDKIERSQLRMPFDGKLATLSLKERQGQFLDKGEPFALAQDDKSFKAVLKLPESELAYVKVGSEVDVKTPAYPGKTFKAIVKVIEPDVEEKDGMKMIRMIISFKSDDESLKSGLSGYAKVDGGTFMVWEVLTHSIYRFITVELWAWIP